MFRPRSVLVSLAAISTLALTCAISALAQSAPKAVADQSVAPSEVLKPGIVIEKIEDEYSAVKQAGMQEGDILLSWSRGEASGKLESPFDLSLAVTEQPPQGPVTFEGFRGTEKRTWTVVNEYWGATTRPNFSDAALAVYHQAMKMAESGQPLAAEHWRAAVGNSQWSRYLWLGPWFLGETGAVLAKAQHWKESDEAYQQAILQAAPTEVLVRAQLRVAWGMQFMLRGNLEQADERFAQAVTESEAINAGNLTANILGHRAHVAKVFGDLSRNQDFLLRSLQIRQRLEPEGRILGDSFVDFGDALFDRGDLAEAEKYFLQALAIYQKHSPLSVGAAFALNNLGETAQLRGDLDQATRYFRKSLAMIEKVDPGAWGHASILRSYASALEEQSKHAEAERCLRQSLAIFEKLAPESLDTAQVLQGQGNIAARQADLKAAEQTYLHALAIREKFASGSLFTAETLHGLGDIALARGDLTKSETYYQQALAIRERLAPKTEKHANTLAALAEIAQREGLVEKATAYYEQALNALESQSARIGGNADAQAYFRAKHENYYREYIDLLVSQKQTVLAFHVLERERARALLETLSTAHIDIHKGAEAALLERERSLRADINAKSERRIRLMGEKGSDQKLRAVESEISDLLLQYQDVEAKLRLSSPVYAALTRPQPLTAKEVQTQLLDPDTLLLEYSLGDERSFLFLITPSALNVYEIPKRSELEQMVRGVYELVTERNRYMPREDRAARLDRLSKAEARLPQQLAKLSQMVLGPLATELGRKRLLVVSDGALQYIPFAILPSPSKPDSPLVLEHEIVNLPSASVLALLRAQDSGRKIPFRTVAVVADPVFTERDTRVAMRAKDPTSADGDDKPLKSSFDDRLTRSAGDVGILSFARLPFSRQEADAIISVTPKGEGLEALDFDASRLTVTSPKLAHYRIVHFATHGLLDNEHPELSGLVFSLVNRQGKPQNGFVTLEDIFNFELPVDLVVLSACETGLGKEIRGEGLVGLTRGFMYAGASRVVASLWSVDDVATADLMQSFYQGMLRDGLSPAAALRRAQIAMWKQKRWTHPYNWGAFVLQGEWKPLSR